MIAEHVSREYTLSKYGYLCARAARRFVRPGLDRADLEQVAAIGLIKAIDRFNPAAETPFEAYAWLLIIGELMHYVRDSERMLRAPRRLRDLERRWLEAERDLWSRYGREPSYREIMMLVGATPTDCWELREYQAAMQVVSFEALRPVEHQALAYSIEAELERVDLDVIIASFSELERTILAEVYQLETSITELARKLGYSRRHVARLHHRTLRKLASIVCQ